MKPVTRPDPAYFNWCVASLEKHWMHYEPHLINVLMQHRGWLPMQKGERVTVHFGDEEYRIERVK